MRYRMLASAGTLAVVIAIVSFEAARVAGQSPTAAAVKTGASAYTAPRTPDGQPDLQGIWDNSTSTPLERPKALSGKDVLSDEEFAKTAVQRKQARENRDRRDQKPGSVTDVGRAYNALWFPVPGDPIKRTSLIVDPPDGRVPALTPEARKRFEAYANARGRFGGAASPEGREAEVEDGTEGGVDGRGTRADNPEDRQLSERCITFGGVPRLPGGYNNHFNIVQGAGYVVIEMEMIHAARIIPLDGRPHLPAEIGMWYGDARGRWEGDTLVVDTINFTDKAPFRGSFAKMHLVERFKRVDEDTIEYQFTVDDPTTWTRPWTAAFPLKRLSASGGEDGVTVPQVFEYACHEGNYGLAGQLRGARALEKAAEENAKKGSN